MKTLIVLAIVAALAACGGGDPPTCLEMIPQVLAPDGSTHLAPNNCPPENV